MKKLSLALVLLLLLTGCTKPDSTPSASPPGTGSTTPAPTSSASPMPTPTPEKQWWEGLGAADLPTEVEPIGNISSMDGPVCLALLPEADIGLYGDPDPAKGVLLRKGDYVQFFPQTYSTARYPSPELNWTDLDGDKELELVVKYLVNDSDGDIVYELHIYEWDGKIWTDHAFDQAAYRALLDGFISYQYKDGYVTLVAGGSSTRGWYEGEEAPKGLAPLGDLVFFRPVGSGYAVIFGLRLELPGGDRYDIATLTANIKYEGENFSLTNYYLESVGGV